MRRRSLPLVVVELGDLRGRHRAAQHVREGGRRGPQQQEGQRRREVVRTQREHQERDHERGDRARDHLDEEGADALQPPQAGCERGDGGGGLPLEQAPPREHQAAQREHDRVDHLARVVGEEGEADERLRQVGAERLEARADEHAERLLAASLEHAERA